MSGKADRLNGWVSQIVPDVADIGQVPADWSVHVAGDFGLAFHLVQGGVILRSLRDLKLNRELLAGVPVPLFKISMRAGDGEVFVTADAGWQQAHVVNARDGFTLEWSEPLDERLRPLTVTLTATADARRHAWRMTLRVDNAGSAWSVWRVVFPQVALAKFDEKSVVLVPSGPGEVKRGAWDEAWSYDQPYGQAWNTMQLMAAYAESASPTGLYLGTHDPFGSAKDMRAVSDPAAPSVTLAYDIPAADMGRAGNGYAFSGECVWQLLRGDWYDAALIYREWAEREARWWPHDKLGPQGRIDTPAWTRELCAWLQAGFVPGTSQGLAPAVSVEPVKRFRQLVDLPVAVHWYAWHQIPFDNDYPHYFPTKEGFAEAVRELQQAGVYNMPYINGRLWDTHDRGTEDFEFTRVALPAATKDEHGQPYTERYGSKEADGSPVTLAAMCPATPLWQDRVRDLVMRLINEVGVDSVYIDQVAAMRPALCMDESHGHPLGGGHWWNEGYWRMIDRIRAELPEGRMLTTECNAEAFLPQFDAYLTWHWQHDGMVPVFPAIYAGTIQCFGRAYAGDALAQRMKAGQQLVFGEQIGWFNPAIIDDAELAAYLRQLIRLRWQLRRYFYAGGARCLRPPALRVPQVKADWQWSGECWVTADAVMTGAWALPGENKLALLFVNVSDEPVTAELVFNARDYDDAGLNSDRLHFALCTDAGPALATEVVPSKFRRTFTFAPRSAVAWELSPM
jgi:hypothetical protein